MTETFNKKEKLKSKILIEQVFAEGKSVKFFPIKLIYSEIKDPEIHTFKVGVSVPKRSFKLAVHRNKLKRLLREAYRKNKYLLEESNKYYACMFIYIGRKPEDFSAINSTMEKLLHKFIAQEKL